MAGVAASIVLDEPDRALDNQKTLDRDARDPRAPPPNDRAAPGDEVRRAIETARDLQARALERLDDTLVRLIEASADAPRDVASPSDDQAILRASDDRTAVSRLLDSIRHLDRASSLRDILETLTAHAAREIARCALLVVRDGRLRCLAQVGFASDVIDRLFDVPANQPSVIARVLRTRTACVTAESGSDDIDLPFAPVGGGVAFAAPLVVAGAVVAVLYADEGDAGIAARTSLAATPSSWPEILEALSSHASRCAENVTLSRLLGDEPDVAAASVSNAPDPFASRDGAPAATDREEAARRYARLLVSEIRLYHEAEVDAGRQNGDLDVRLGPEIARARRLYQARIHPTLADRDAYFDDELARTLGDVT